MCLHLSTKLRTAALTAVYARGLCCDLGSDFPQELRSEASREKMSGALPTNHSLTWRKSRINELWRANERARERERERERECVCAFLCVYTCITYCVYTYAYASFVCVCVRARTRTCTCVSVWDGGYEREREREREKESVLGEREGCSISFSPFNILALNLK